MANKLSTVSMLSQIASWVNGKLALIRALIPSQATSSNQLADKAFVNSSIATATATFRGTYNVVSDLSLSHDATHVQIGAAIATKMSALSIPADNNDYVFIQIPTSDETPTEIHAIERYKFDGTAWSFEYQLNNSGFTSAQWSAINSGATLELIGKLSALPTNAELTTLLNAKVSYDDNGAYDVSAHNSSATFASLSALLSNENIDTLIPAAVRKGGMSIKFVLTSDNNYVQYRLMHTLDNASTAAADFANTANWQGVDDNLIFGSHNLVESVGVLKKISIFNSNTPTDYSNDVAELYLSNMPAGRVCVKYYNNYAYLISPDNTIASRVNIANASNNIPYPVAVYSGATAEYPNGTVVGYIMFRDISSFITKANAAVWENVNRDYCENIANSPLIASNIGLVEAKSLVDTPSIQASGNNIKITAGRKTSPAFTVPFSANAANATNATNVAAANTEHSGFVKELYLFGSGVDTSKVYKITGISRNHSTYKWGILISDGTTGVSALSNQQTEPSNILLIPELNNSGVQAYAIVNWDEFEDGSNNVVDITLLPRVFDINYSPIIKEYLDRVDDVNSVREDLDSVREDLEDFENDIKSEIFCDYLLKDSTFLSSNGITSSNMLHAFLKDFKLTIEKEEGYQYGILKVNNGLPANKNYSYCIIVYKWPKNSTPTSSNATNIGGYGVKQNPTNGKILLKQGSVEIGEVDVDWSVLTEVFGGNGYFDGCGDGLRYNQDYLFGTDTSIEGRTRALETKVNDLEYEIEHITPQIENIEICVPDTIYAVVGDVLQLYYFSIFRCVNYSTYDITVTCDIGDTFPRYFEVTPNANNIGSHSITFTIKDNNNVVLGTKTCLLVVTSVGVSPSNSINVLCVGASGTQKGEWASEFKRRLVGVSGEPYGDEKNNIFFVGRKSVTYDGKQVNLEATGGYQFASYTSLNTARYRFDVTAANEPIISVGDIYSNNGNNYTIVEINITAGQGGYFSCEGEGVPTSSGTLTKVSGSGSETITFSSTSYSGNPFVYNGVIDMQQYADDYCNPQEATHGKIDVVYTELFGNGSVAYADDLSSRISQMQAFINQIKTTFPNCKFCIGLCCNLDVRGGLGINYHASGDWSKAYGMKYTFMNLCNALQKYINDNDMSDYVFIMNWLNEFDTVNDFRQTTKKVNPRSDVTEIFGVNGAHPSVVGYNQMADTAWRLFVAKFCQST